MPKPKKPKKTLATRIEAATPTLTQRLTRILLDAAEGRVSRDEIPARVAACDLVARINGLV